jgi:hypothetical protein
MSVTREQLPVVAWADAGSNRVSKKRRPDWVTPEPLVRLSDVRDALKSARDAAYAVGREQGHAEGARDGSRLDWLEHMAKQPGGLLLHDGSETGRLGLGLFMPARTLRQAIDTAMSTLTPTADPQGDSK